MARLCAGGVKLRKQTDERFPRRDRRTDGWIGNKEHSTRASMHNPDSEGIVYALDLDENMGKAGKWRNGRTARLLANQLVAYGSSNAPGHERVLYVVYENQIASGTYKSTWWKWRGKGYGHTAHIHISFTKKARNDAREWPLPILTRNPIKKRAWRKALKTRK